MGRSLHNILISLPRIRTRQGHDYLGSENTFEVVDLEPRSGLLNRVSATAENEQILIHN